MRAKEVLRSDMTRIREFHIKSGLAERQMSRIRFADGIRSQTI